MNERDEVGNAILGIGGGCLLLVLLGSLAFVYATGEAAKGCCDAFESSETSRVEPIQQLSTALASGTTKSAYYDLMSARYRDLHTFSDFQSEMDGMPLLHGGQVHFLGRVGSRHTAVSGVSVSVSKNKKKALFTFAMVREAGRMKIDRVHPERADDRFDQIEAETTYLHFLHRLRVGQSTEAYDDLHFEWRVEMDKSTFDAMVRAEQEVLTGPAIKVAKVEWVDDKEVLLTGTPTGDEASTPRVVARLRLFDRYWRLRELRVERPAPDILELPPAKDKPEFPKPN